MLLDRLIKRITALAESLLRLEGALPRLEQASLTILDALFAPRQIAIHIAVSAVLHMLVMSCRVTGRTIENLWKRVMSETGRRVFELEYKMEHSRSYHEWLKHANDLDVLRGMDKWRRNENDSPQMDARMLRRRIQDTERMLESGDLFDLMFRLRGGLMRDQWGTSHEGLYSMAAGGTKHIIDEYQSVCSKALNYICDKENEEVPEDVKLAFFNETRHSYGRTALLLSGGAYLGYYHMGVSRALFVEGLLPRVISGASAGSLMAAMIGTKTDAELDDLWNMPEGQADSYRRDYFSISTQIKSPLGKQIASLMPENLHWLAIPAICLLFDGKLINLDIQHLQRVVIENVGMWTFQEAFDRTGRIINITVAPLNNYDPPRLLNYLTAPHVCVWSAAVASCAIPGVFDSCILIVKEPNGNYRPENAWTRSGPGEEKAVAGGGYSDGSIENDLPMQQLSELFNVNHFIVSQTNAHSALLSALSLKSSQVTSPLLSMIVGYTEFLQAQFRDWLKNLISFVSYRPDAPSWKAKRGLAMMLTQNYEGRANDVTIMPWRSHLSVLQAWGSIIKNPTDAEYLGVINAGQAATWPFLARIRAQCSVEMTLDRCVQRLRRRLASGEGISSSSRPKQGMDRTPSFYTSRSIINLSGLGVADPLPDLSTRTLDAKRHQFPDASHTQSKSKSPSSNNSSGSLADELWGGSSAVQITSLHADDGQGGRSKGGGSPSSDIEAVCKTTTMARFYYKRNGDSRDSLRSSSQDNLPLGLGVDGDD